MRIGSEVPESTCLLRSGEEQSPSVDYLQKQVAYLRTLNEVSRKLQAKLEPEDVLTGTLNAALEALAAERGCLFLADPVTGELELRRLRGLRRATANGKPFEITRTIIERVWRSGKPALTRTTPYDPHSNQYGRKAESCRSILCAPLRAHGQYLGVLYLDRRFEVGPFGTDDLTLATGIAEEAARALFCAQRYTRQRQAAVEEERRRVARYLHDTVVQSLYGIGIATQTALKRIDQADANGCVRDTLRQIRATSQTALAEMREQLQHLHPSTLADRRLAETLDHYCQVLSKYYSLELEVLDDPELSLSVCQREALYFVAREALWNIVRHSGAKRASIRLSRDDGHATMCVVDDGIGFDPALVSCDETIGLRSMGERLQLLWGSLGLESAPGAGTRVTARIPINGSLNGKQAH